MTIILHGTWLPQAQRLFVWGEDGQAFGRAARKAKIPAHPFQATVADLQRLTAHCTPRAEPAEQEQVVWLPAVAGRPAPLRELRNAGIEAPEGEASLAAWRVRGLSFDALAASELLLRLEESDSLGSDLLAWRVAARLVAELVAGEQFLPALERDGPLLRACWQPRPLATTARSLARLAGALPPLCRAVVADHTRAPPAQALIDDFTGVYVDRLVRDLARTEDATVTSADRWRRQIGAVGAAWLAALFSDERLVALKGREADELFRAWRAWFEQEQVAGDEQFRITFRLEEPDAARPNQAPWTLRYLLQATDDPSLLVPASQLWQERGAMFQYLDRRFAHPQERLLHGLGFAARLIADFGLQIAAHGVTMSDDGNDNAELPTGFGIIRAPAPTPAGVVAVRLAGWRHWRVDAGRLPRRNLAYGATGVSSTTASLVARSTGMLPPVAASRVKASAANTSTLTPYGAPGSSAPLQ